MDETKPNLGDALVADRFFEPMLSALASSCEHTRQCPATPDEKWLRVHVQRVISSTGSGREHLQLLAEVLGLPTARSTFFDGLKSPRRRALLEEVSAAVYREADRRLAAADHLALIPALAGRAIFAVDGHHIDHAVHALRDKSGQYVSTATIYALDLHVGLLRPLASVQGDGHHAHEMPVFRKVLPELLPEHSRGIPIVVGDPAYVDLAFWHGQKIERTAAVITRMKANMKPTTIRTLPFDKGSELNTGVVSFEQISFGESLTFQRVCYRDPETGTEYDFLTSVDDLEPGLIGFLYLLRWRIEKVYDTAKNKLGQTKAWANGPVAQTMQSHFVALTHNLLVLFLEQLRLDHGLTDQKLIDKRLDHLADRAARAQCRGSILSPFLRLVFDPSQLSAQFIRSVRNLMTVGTRYSDAIPRFRCMLAAYL